VVGSHTSNQTERRKELQAGHCSSTRVSIRGPFRRLFLRSFVPIALFPEVKIAGYVNEVDPIATHQLRPEKTRSEIQAAACQKQREEAKDEKIRRERYPSGEIQLAAHGVTDAGQSVIKSANNSSWNNPCGLRQAQ
jgi:hypothetical protein